MPLLLISEIFAHFVNTLTVDEKYSLHKHEISQEQIQTKLSKKEITLSELFAFFLKFTSIFNIFFLNNRHSLYILEITQSKRRG